MAVPKLHLIGHAHIDPAWLWRWAEGLAEVLATVRSALDRIAEHPQFVFVCGSAAFYEFVERIDPAMFGEIVAAVKAGRWELMGGGWVEPDTNVTSGEALVRQAVLSQRYFESRFGRTPTIAFNPDGFGHSAGLAQILAGSGLDGYVFMRPEPKEAELPRSFRWRTAGGHSVRAYRIPVAYCTWPDTLDAHLAEVSAALTADGVAAGMCFYGVGNHGGGPTQANLRALDARIAAGESMAYSTPHRFFIADSADDLPDVTGELGFHARGAYSANSALKAEIRRADAALIGAEGAATLASLLAGLEYPAERLDSAWKALLCAGFHDVAAGTVIRSAAAEALSVLAGVAAAADRITDDSHVALAWNTAMAADPDETVLVVFNPHPWPARLPVEAEVSGSDRIISNQEGHILPFQQIASEAVTGDRRRITWLADLPAGGWALYRWRTGSPVPTGPQEWDGVWPYLPWVTAIPDDSDTWSHGVDAYDRPAEHFQATATDVLEDGPVRRVVSTVARCRRSSITQTFTQYAGSLAIRVDVLLDWREKGAVAKLRFPVDTDARVCCDAPYASVIRPADGCEYAGGAWITVDQLSGGFTIANDAKYSYDVRPGSVGITIARSPVSAHHEPALADRHADLDWLDQGPQAFSYLITPDADPLAAARAAAELLRPARLAAGSHHPSARLDPLVARLSVEGAALGALKRSFDGTGTVVRVHNPRLAGVPAKVTMGGRSLSLDLPPNEIATVYFADNLDEPVRLVDLLEHD